MPKRRAYPTWICHPCGVAHGKWYEKGDYKGPSHYCSTFHTSTCDLCGAKDVSVTEPRDYGGLVAGWNTRNQEEAPRLNKTVASVPPASDTKTG